MLFSINGKVQSLESRSIIIDCNGLGYEILVSKPCDFKINENVFLYLHHVIKEDDEYLVGFKDNEEKNVFKLLLNVQGIGPKSALNILSNVTPNDLLVAISNNDIDFIESIPGVGGRVASQILLDLKEYIKKINKENSTLYNETKAVLKSLKFKAKDIDKVLPKIYMPNATRDELLKEALRRLSNNVQSFR